MHNLAPPDGMPLALRRHLRALAGGFLPEASRFAEADWVAMEEIIDEMLGRRPAPMRRQLGLFVRLISLAARVRHGRSLSRLTPGQLRALLQRLERSSLLLVRRGTWGLRTLVFMGYYTRPEAAAAIGYRATPAGWGARR